MKFKIVSRAIIALVVMASSTALATPFVDTGQQSVTAPMVNCTINMLDTSTALAVTSDNNILDTSAQLAVTSTTTIALNGTYVLVANSENTTITMNSVAQAAAVNNIALNNIKEAHSDAIFEIISTATDMVANQSETANHSIAIINTTTTIELTVTTQIECQNNAQLATTTNAQGGYDVICPIEANQGTQNNYPPRSNSTKGGNCCGTELATTDFCFGASVQV